jgi:serine phosphatase RsbU (regulator of sigma subunit)
LVLSTSGPHYLSPEVGLPLGIEPSTYVSTNVLLAQGSTLLAFTDGLVERRGESIEVGLQRLADAATGAAGAPTGPEGALDDLVSSVIDQLAQDGAEDDLAVLAVRWRANQQQS